MVRFWKRAEAAPDRVMIVDPDGTELTARHILEKVNGLTNALSERGVGQGDAVAVALHNRHQWLVAYLAAMQAGWYLVPVNHHLTAPEMTHLVSDSGSRALLAEASEGDTCRAVAEAAGVDPALRLSVGPIAGFEPMDAVLAASSADRPQHRTAGAVMYYTSGTTGKPKGVRRPLPGGDPDDGPLPFSDLLTLFGVEENRDDVHLCTSPLYHTAVLAFAVSSLHMGHPVVLMDRWSAEGALERIARHRVTHTHMVPTQFRRLLLLPEGRRQDYDCSSLRCVVHGAAPCEVSIKQSMLAWWGPVIFEYYGTTEGGGTVVTPDDWLAHPGTVGQPWPGAEIKILDESHQQVPPKTPGTVYIRSGPADFEYYNDAQKTAAGRVGDFFTVGDIGYMDADGYLYLVGRSSELIISGGINVYPAEIEAALIAQAEVGDVAVAGEPDPDKGEVVRAFVELAPGCEPSRAVAEHLLEMCRQRLAPFKLPRSITFVASLPRDPNGKLPKRLLAAQEGQTFTTSATG